MSDTTQQITEILLEKYGPFLSIDELAEALKRSPKGFRITLQQDGEVSRRLAPAKEKVGRRVYFNAVTIAEIMTEGIRGH